ncbi:MAG: iron-sulfur cluster assembly accessory protein, partial [Sandarakinorhabdus sp.]|nr:iron-sulfur cluster assembly accessory protein [Sandarakinorhabdus sp.]
MDVAVATRRPRPAPITVTENAARRIAEITAKAPQPPAGVRLTTPKRGCSGLAYSLD